jgi:carboxymethylenebutenolidase
METRSETIVLNTGDGTMSAFVAAPTANGTYPGVIVAMEAFGLNQHVKDVTSRIAGQGYVAAAPDMYHRERGAVVGYDALPEAVRLMRTLSDDGIVQDVETVLAFLRGHGAVRRERIGITGFCMGGRISFLAACRNSGLKAAVPFYGGGIGALLPIASQLSCPTLLFFGDQDPFIPADEVEEIRTTLSKLGKAAEIQVYPGAPHGFFCDERDSYRPAAAQDAWDRLMQFFAEHLKS